MVNIRIVFRLKYTLIIINQPHLKKIPKCSLVGILLIKKKLKINKLMLPIRTPMFNA